VALALAVCCLSACGTSGNTYGYRPPTCASEEEASNGVVLMAQSVPTASWIPCLRRALPGDWTFSYLDAHNGSAVFVIKSMHSAEPVAVNLTRTCDTAGATEVPTDREGLRRLERVTTVSPHYMGRRFYVFDGGCITVVFNLEGGENPSEALALATDSVGVVSRAFLQDQVREESGGRLELDAGGTP
jgi:hypothetical protein